LPKTRFFGLHFLLQTGTPRLRPCYSDKRPMVWSFLKLEGNLVDIIGLKSYGKITQNNVITPFKVIRSPLSVRMESTYATSY